MFILTFFMLEIFKIRQKCSKTSEISAITFQLRWAWAKGFRNVNAIITLHRRLAAQFRFETSKFYIRRTTNFRPVASWTVLGFFPKKSHIITPRASLTLSLFLLQLLLSNFSHHCWAFSLTGCLSASTISAS